MTDANFVREVREDLSGNPTCEVCGAVMLRVWKMGTTLVNVPIKYGDVGLWKCLSCGATKEAS